MFLPDRQSLEFFPDYRSTQVAWQGLMPFGAWVMRAARPRRVVELGSYRGDSFFTLLQASRGLTEVEELWAVDSWAGDIHTGPYGEDVFAQFLAEHARRADPRARHLRMTFDAALEQFEAGSIDLLHIDGAHDYESVRHDFESWLPKMAADGIVLFHDTEVRTDDFGVYRLWAEIMATAPGRCRNLPFSNGLGILCLGQAQTHAIQEFCALPDGAAKLAEHALKVAGDGIIALSRYEYGLMSRTGDRVEDNHVFARGQDVESLRALWQTEVSLRDIPAPGMAAPEVSTIVEKRAGELAAQVEENMAYALRRVRSDLIETLTQRFTEMIETQSRTQAVSLEARSVRLQDQISALREGAEATDARLAADMALLERTLAEATEKTRSAIGDAIDALLRNRSAEIHAAISAQLQQDIERKIRPALKGFEKRVAQILAETLPRQEALVEPMIRRTIKLKNDAQDDAIIGIGAKVDAHEEAIQSLSRYLGDLLRHPIFAP